MIDEKIRNLRRSNNPDVVTPAKVTQSELTPENYSQDDDIGKENMGPVYTPKVYKNEIDERWKANRSSLRNHENSEKRVISRSKSALNLKSNKSREFNEE